MSDTNILLVYLKDNENDTARIESVLAYALSGYTVDEVTTAEELRTYLMEDRKIRRILFAVPLGNSGINLECYKLIRFLRENDDILSGFTGGVLIDAESELYTKSVGGELTFTANCAGCAFVGKPLVEGTKSLANFKVLARNKGMDWSEAYKESAKLLVKSIFDFKPTFYEKPNLLVLHASSHETSNTYALWHRVKEQLVDFEITEIGLRNGTLSDCSGCPYKTCLHFGEKGSCFYGGVVVDEVYPAILKANAIILLCPNYNDSLSANLTAFINRLTALFRAQGFHDKSLFSIVVSGYSGSDIVAQQLIRALNMNKAFYLPGHFSLMETANDAGSAMKLPEIEKRLIRFAEIMRQSLTGKN